MKRLHALLQTYPNIGFRLSALLFLLITGIAGVLFGAPTGLIVAVALSLMNLYIWTYQTDRFKRGMMESPNPIFVVRRDGTVIAINHATEKVLGYGQELIGQNVSHLLVDEATADHVREMLAQVFATGQSVINIDLRYRTRQGDLHEMISRLYPITDRQGAVQECILSNTEMTERRQMEAALRESENRFQLIADNVSEVFYIFDIVSGKLLYISPNFQEQWGNQGDTLFDDPFSFLTLLQPDDAEKVQQAYQSGQNNELEIQLPVPGQGMRWMRLSSNFVHDEQGNPIRMVGVVDDITDRKHGEELALEHERMRILASFIRDASHEFRTPLSIINTKLYLIEHMHDPLRTKALIVDINDQVNQIVRLLDSLVMMSQLDSGIEFRIQPVDLNALVASITTALQPRAKEQELAFVTDLDPHLPNLTGDRDLLEDALENLLDNGLRYTPAGGRISIRTAAEDGGVVVEICDTGSGIEPEIMPRIFERFYRADDARSLRGFGLGLPIARQIIEGHNGTITVNSTPDKGTCIRVVLPLSNGVMPENSAPV